MFTVFTDYLKSFLKEIKLVSQHENWRNLKRLGS